MKNILREEINQIQYLFGYKKGVVISEQNELGSAPAQLFTYINGRKELSTDFLSGKGNDGKWVGPEVKEWCKKNATENSVCVLGKSIDEKLAKTRKLSDAVNLAKNDGYVNQKIGPIYINSLDEYKKSTFEEDSGDGTKQIKHYWGAVYSKI